MKLSTFITSIIFSVILTLGFVILGFSAGFSEGIIRLVALLYFPLSLIIFLIIDLTHILKEKQK